MFFLLFYVLFFSIIQTLKIHGFFDKLYTWLGPFWAETIPMILYIVFFYFGKSMNTLSLFIIDLKKSCFLIIFIQSKVAIQVLCIMFMRCQHRSRRKTPSHLPFQCEMQVTKESSPWHRQNPDLTSAENLNKEIFKSLGLSDKEAPNTLPSTLTQWP